MGIFINWELKFNGSKKDLIIILKEIIEKIQDLPIKSTSNIESFKINRKKYRNNWLRETFSSGMFFDKNYFNYKRLIGFFIKIDSEQWMKIYLADKNRDYWKGKSNIKTSQFQEDIFNHLLIVRILDIIKGTKINVKVRDETHFYKNRDIELLGAKLSGFKQILSQYVGYEINTIEIKKNLLDFNWIEIDENYEKKIEFLINIMKELNE